ncbi:KRAB [Lepeophtheirus salmonis]|uniref:KRAB n=1 Tax=Lepeophtheirus salmonis TaxID=72036 RepID=A0A7R8CVV3_LEPSM|nr:KRAB [Lepeophtheirus salmonis]CAF2914580.1 KRAB [Lepeophtheirus salmonis]
MRKNELSCKLCDNVIFESQETLESHLASHSGSNGKNFSCEKCGKQFGYKSSLMQHIKLHGDSRVFKCQFCSKSFSPLKRLLSTNYMKKRHKGEKPWKCELCEKAFLHQSTWKYHMMRHKGDKSFNCSNCKKSFTEPWALKKHMRTHNEGRCWIQGKYRVSSSLPSLSWLSHRLCPRLKSLLPPPPECVLCVWAFLEWSIMTLDNSSLYGGTGGDIVDLLPDSPSSNHENRAVKLALELALLQGGRKRDGQCGRRRRILQLPHGSPPTPPILQPPTTSSSPSPGIHFGARRRIPRRSQNEEKSKHDGVCSCSFLGTRS